MTQSTIQSRRSEGGFTLVELAIVMIIIGLLIGGILKGQELINNARVSSTVAQIKAVESGISAFRDKYAALPGDIALPGTRLPGCTGTLCATTVAATAGTLGNGIIENTALAVNPGLAVDAATEAGIAFVHMGAAGMLGGVQPAAAAAGVGVSHPTTPLGGAWRIGASQGTASGMLLTTGLPSGVYMATGPALAVLAAGDTQVMTPIAAANIDRKVDDGMPNTGIVRAIGATTIVAASCTNGAVAASVYQESAGATSCGIYAKVQ